MSLKHVLTSTAAFVVGTVIICSKVPAQELPAKPEVVALTDFVYRGNEVRSIWSMKKHPNGIVTINCSYWPRENEIFVGTEHFQARLESDAVGVYLSCYSQPGKIIEKLYLSSSERNKLGVQIVRSVNKGSAGTLKDAGSLPYTEPLGQYFEAVDKAHNALNAYLVSRDNFLNPLVQKAVQDYHKTMLDSAMGWFDVGVESKRNRWDD